MKEVNPPVWKFYVIYLDFSGKSDFFASVYVSICKFAPENKLFCSSSWTSTVVKVKRNLDGTYILPPGVLFSVPDLEQQQVPLLKALCVF